MSVCRWKGLGAKLDPEEHGLNCNSSIHTLRRAIIHADFPCIVIGRVHDLAVPSRHQFGFTETTVLGCCQRKMWNRLARSTQNTTVCHSEADMRVPEVPPLDEVVIPYFLFRFSSLPFLLLLASFFLLLLLFFFPLLPLPLSASLP